MSPPLWSSPTDTGTAWSQCVHLAHSPAPRDWAHTDATRTAATRGEGAAGEVLAVVGGITVNGIKEEIMLGNALSCGDLRGERRDGGKDKVE